MLRAASQRCKPIGLKNLRGRRIGHQQACYAAVSSQASSKRIALPLHERPARYNAPSRELQSWYKQIKQHTNSMAEHFQAPDDPSAEDLQRELGWLLEDAIDGNWRLVQGQSVSPEEPSLALRIPFHQLQSLWQQRLQDRLPLQYLTNSAHWGDFILAVGPGVLIPRPETYCLIQFAEEACRQNRELAGGSWVDLGTGSGALAIGLARQITSLKKVIAVDRSSVACEWASANVNRFRLSAKIQVRNGSWFEPLHNMKGQLAGILSNPPYIKTETLTGLQAEVRLHEPEDALDGGGGLGVCCLEQICSKAAEHLRIGGFLALEMGGPEQTAAVSSLEALTSNFRSINRLQDMFGIERFVTAVKK